LRNEINAPMSRINNLSSSASFFALFKTWYFSAAWNPDIDPSGVEI
jgi:hypothetical protein